MLYRNSATVRRDLVCDRLCLDLHREDFLYYDKDGFELNRAEQKYYRIMGFKLDQCLNHNAYTKNWYVSQDPKLIVDHSLILYRCEYVGDARKQLAVLKPCVPQASLLEQTRAKWGFDFALDSTDSKNNIYEVLHIEYDTNFFDKFEQELNTVQEKIDSIDWLDAAERILTHRGQWQTLRGFEQNNWKARYLLNWTRAEFTEKTI